MELKFTAKKQPETLSVAVQRRQRLARRIEQQIKLIQDMKDGQSPRGAWAWMDEAGSYFLPIKYGRQPIELKKGMFSVHCGSLDECAQAFEAVRGMVLAGDFDEQITKASVEIRKRFGG